jgi:hypothetical protein
MSKILTNFQFIQGFFSAFVKKNSLKFSNFSIKIHDFPLNQKDQKTIDFPETSRAQSSGTQPHFISCSFTQVVKRTHRKTPQQK